MKTLILGANGQIARLTEEMLSKKNLPQRLFLRNSTRLQGNVLQEVVEGSASYLKDLEKVMTGIDIVYANLAGKDIENQAENVVTAMEKEGVKRLIWISTLGIYDEVLGDFGKWNHQMLDGGYLETYAKAAKVIESSSLNYTIIRPAWLTNHDEISYELTAKGEIFKGTEVSRKSVADLIVQIIENPTLYPYASLGINKPHTDGKKPSWY